MRTKKEITVRIEVLKMGGLPERFRSQAHKAYLSALEWVLEEAEG